MHGSPPSTVVQAIVLKAKEREVEYLPQKQAVICGK